MNTTVQLALKEWKAARAALSNAIQSYLAACHTLDVACATPLRRSAERIKIGESLLAVDSEFASLAAEEYSLLNSRKSLTMRRNHSATLAPVNTLPPEILAYIFALSLQRCGARVYRFHDPAAVCAYWRQVALNATDLWSHVDIDADKPGGWTNLFFERAAGSPIYAHVDEPVLYCEHEIQRPQEMTRKTLDLLAPHIRRINTLEIAACSGNGDFLSHVLNKWLDHGSIKSSNSLVVHVPPTSPVLLAPGANASDGDRIGITRSQNAEELLHLLGTLHLQNAYFDWSSSVYHGLVELQLGFNCGYPDFPMISTSQFTKILCASPALTTLKLDRLGIHQAGVGKEPAPALMGHLKTLNLVGMEPKSLALVLPLISLSGSLAGISLGISLYNRVLGVLEEFLTRSRITTLYCKDTGDDKHLGSPRLPSPRSLNNIRALVLDTVGSSNMLLFVRADPPISRSPSFYPPSVTILGAMPLEDLEGFVSGYGIRELCLASCATGSKNHKPPKLK
ncbi:hypothetical protein FRC09_006284, partial [Ceratobasidium sp. 395]